MVIARRRILFSIAGMTVAVVPASPMARAQSWPARPVRLIVGFTPGGPTDILARLMGQWLTERLGQTFVVENRPGAGSNIGTEAVVSSAPDGYTLLLISTSAAISATFYDKLSFNLVRDLAPVAGIARVPMVMVVNPSVPARTVAEFIAYAKENPGKVNMASVGNGTTPHMAGELFKMMAGVDMLHVRYRGGAPALTDLIGGRAQVLFEGMPSVVEHVRLGRLRAGGDDQIALAGAAGRAQPGRIPPGLRGERVVRNRCAAKHAVRDCRSGQSRNQRRACRSEPQRAARRPGRHGAPWFVSRVRSTYFARDREMGKGGPCDQPQARVTLKACPAKALGLDPRAGTGLAKRI